MERLELEDDLKVLYTSKKATPIYVDVPDMNYLTFHGKGHPAQEDFQLACEALFTISYILKFDIARKELNKDYKVNPMEVTWYLDKKEDGIDFTWDMMIMQPDFITTEMIDKSFAIANAKKKQLEYSRIGFSKIHFGKCIQCFHKGDYNNMNATLKTMLDRAKQDNLEHDLYTHDIYLNDMRKTKVENYKTIMRIRVW